MLPFIAGLATGVVAVVAYKNNKKIKAKIEEGACSVKKLAQDGLEKSKEAVENVKQRFEDTKQEQKEPKTTTKAKTVKKRVPKAKTASSKEDTK